MNQTCSPASISSQTARGAGKQAATTHECEQGCERDEHRGAGEHGGREWPGIKASTREEVPPEQRVRTPKAPAKLVNWGRNHFCHQAPGRPQASNEFSRAQVLGRDRKVSGAGPGRNMNSY